MAGFFESVFAPENLYAGGRQLYNQMAGLTLDDISTSAPKRAHGSRPRVVRKGRKDLPVMPRPAAAAGAFTLDAPDGWDVGIDTPETLARAAAAAAGPQDNQARPQGHMAAMLDALSNLGADRAMAQQNPSPLPVGPTRDMFEAVQGMGASPRQFQDQYQNADPRNQPITTGQENIDQHLAARFPQGQGGAYQLLEEQAQRRRAVEKALTDEMDRAQLAGERRGYGSQPYAYMDNQVVDPRALQPEHDMSIAEKMQRMAGLNAISEQGGRVDQGSLPPHSDATVQLSPGDVQGPNAFRQGAGQAYVDLQRQALSQMDGGVNPASIPRNTFQGQDMDPEARAAYDAREAARRAPILAHYRDLKKQREDTIAALARRRMEAAEARNMANAVGGFRSQGLTSRDALAAAMMGGMGGEGGPQNQAAMDMVFPEVSQLAMRRKLTDGQVARDQAETNAINNPMQAVMRNLALNPNTPPEMQGMILNYLQQQGGGGKAPGAGAGPAPFPVDQFQQAGQRASLGLQLQAAQSPEQAISILLAHPEIQSNPQQMSELYAKIAHVLTPEAINTKLGELDPGNYSAFGSGGSNYYRDAPFWQFPIGAKHETEDEYKTRMRTTEILKKIKSQIGF